MTYGFQSIEVMKITERLQAFSRLHATHDTGSLCIKNVVGVTRNLNEVYGLGSSNIAMLASKFWYFYCMGTVSSCVGNTLLHIWG